MKRTILYTAVIALGLASCAQPTQTEKWIKDLDYLNNKIQKQFDSYHPEVKEQFQQEIEGIKSNINSLESYELPCEIMRALALLKDGHTELNVGQRKVGFHRMPVLLYFFENDLHVIAAHEEHATLLGAKISSIGQMPINEVFEKLKNRMSADNEMEYLHAGPGYLILTELLACIDITDDPMSTAVSFELANGKSVKKTFSGLTAEEYQNGDWKFITTDEPPLYRSNRTDSYWFKWLPQTQTMYVHIARMNDQSGKPSIKKFTAKLFDEVDSKKPAKLIIDVRTNNGGNYNLSRPIVEAIKERPWLNKAGKLWMITGRRTFSAASVMAIFLKKETEAILIGEPGRTHPNQADNNEYIDLPYSDYLIEYTTKIKKHWPERPELSVVPVDISIDPDLDSYAHGRDKVLEYILSRK